MEDITYIHYGHDVYDSNKFNTPINDWIKPIGGLWASPIDATNGFRNWCMNQDWSLRPNYFDTFFTFKLKESANVLHLRKNEDINLLTFLNMDERESIKFIDFESMIKSGIDAIELHLSENEMINMNNSTISYGPFTDSLYWSLYGWDCDSIVILNKDIIIPNIKKD